MTAKIQALYRYPVKGLSAEALDRVDLRAGEALLCDLRSGYVIERVPRAEVEELVLEEVPDIDYKDIGGLSGQIDQIKDAVELPFLYPDLYLEINLATQFL